jgi:LysM repeat protein
MIALIPGMTAALASLQSQPPTSPSSQDGFSQLLQSASQNLSSSDPPAPPAPASYTVQPGDNLSAIGKKLGYDNTEILAQANNLKNPDQLQIGQVLTLPEKIPGPHQVASTQLAKLADKISASRSQANQPCLREASTGVCLLVRFPASRENDGQRAAFQHVC